MGDKKSRHPGSPPDVAGFHGLKACFLITEGMVLRIGGDRRITATPASCAQGTELPCLISNGVTALVVLSNVGPSTLTDWILGLEVRASMTNERAERIWSAISRSARSPSPW